MNKIDLFELVIHGLIAFMGGVVKIITEGQDLVMKSLTSFVAGGFVGVFAGVLTYFICKHFSVDEYLSIVFTGLAGYMGAPLLEVFAIIAKRTMVGMFGFRAIDDDEIKKKMKK